MINKVTLVGNLGSDPELRRLENGTPVARFSIATNESYKDKEGNWQDQTEWHDVTVWRGLAERAERQLRKGMLVYLEGKLSTRKYQDRNGIDRKSTDVIGAYMRILNRRDGAQDNSETAPASYSTAAPQTATNPVPQTKPGEQTIETTTDAHDPLPF